MSAQKGIAHVLILVGAVVFLVLTGVMYINYQVRSNPRYDNCEPGDGYCEAIQKYRQDIKKLDEPQELYPKAVSINSNIDNPYGAFLLKSVVGQIELKELNKTTSDPDQERVVTTDRGDEVITVKEGYRAIYYSSGYPFSKMHVDKKQGW